MFAGTPVIDPRRVRLHIDAVRIRLELEFHLRRTGGWTVPVTSVERIEAGEAVIVLHTTEGRREIPLKNRSERTLEETVREIRAALASVREPAGREHVPQALSELSRR